MRIVLISAEYPPNAGAGGIATNTTTVAAGLARHGQDVHVVTVGERGHEVAEGVHVWRLRAPRHLGRVASSLRALRLRPDVVQATEWGAEGWLLSRFSRIPVVTRLATPTFLVEELNHTDGGVRSRIFRRLERDQTRHSAAVYAPTRAIVDRVSEAWSLPPGRVEIILNPLDLDTVRAAARGTPPVVLPERFLVYFGGMQRRKGVEELARAAAAVLSDHPDLHLVCVGYEGPPDVMERFHATVAPVAERVHVLGEMAREDALAIVARATLVVCPSHWESFGYVCVEALALGRPVVATSIAGFAEILQDGVTGWLVEPADAAALEAGIRRALADDAERDRVAAAGARRAEDFDVNRLVEQQLALYRRVANGNGRRYSPEIYRAGYRQHFDPDGGHDVFRLLYAEKRDLVVERLHAVPSGRLLDVGGGFGRFSEHLAPYHRVTLCDLSPEMVREARKRLPPTTGVVEADALRLPFPDAAFDTVLAMDLAVHLPDVTEGLVELARVLRPGGTVVFDTTNARALWMLAYPRYWGWRPDRFVRMLASGGVALPWRDTVHHQREEDVRAGITAAGLSVVTMTPIGPGWSPKWHVWWLRKAG